MPNQVTLQGLPEISQDGELIWYTDKTGEYNPTTNTGGFGAPNYELDESCIFLFVYLMTNPTKIITAQTFYNNAALNSDSAVFNAAYDVDGLYAFKTMRLPVSSDDVNLLEEAVQDVPIVEGDYWYNTVESVIKGMIDSQVVVLDLTSVDALNTAFASTSVQISVLTCDQLFYKDLAVSKNERYNKMRKARREENAEQVQRMRTDQIDIILDAAAASYQYAFGFQKEAQDTIETSTERFVK